MKNSIKYFIAIALLTIVMTGCECRHKTWIEATCTTPRTCADCGITEGEPLGHKWKEATCDSPKTCEVCGETEGEPLEHVWLDATCTDPKTCKLCGKTEGKPLGHKWEKATCTKPKTCSVCGETEGETLEHTWIDATCTEPKKCKVCGKTEGKALGHKLDPEPTCTESGICAVCKKEFPAKGHDMNEATCTEPATCKVCGHTEGEPLGHKFESGSCERCGESFTTVINGTNFSKNAIGRLNYEAPSDLWSQEGFIALDNSNLKAMKDNTDLVFLNSYGLVGDTYQENYVIPYFAEAYSDYTSKFDDILYAIRDICDAGYELLRAYYGSGSFHHQITVSIDTEGSQIIVSYLDGIPQIDNTMDYFSLD